MDPEIKGWTIAKAVPLMGTAGSMTIHHVRLVHGSALNTSNRPRRLLLHEYAAADAWPLMGVANFEEFNGRMVLGEPTIEPRLAGAGAHAAAAGAARDRSTRTSAPRQNASLPTRPRSASTIDGRRRPGQPDADCAASSGCSAAMSPR